LLLSRVLARVHCAGFRWSDKILHKSYHLGRKRGTRRENMDKKKRSSNKSRSPDPRRGKLPRPLVLREIPPILTTCFVLNTDNCLVFQADVALSPTSLKGYKLTPIPYRYVTVDPDTLEESEPIDSLCYSCRLWGVAASNSPLSPRSRNINAASIELLSLTLLTSGTFNCHWHGIDSDNNLVLDLINPLTGITMSDHYITKYSPCLERFDGDHDTSHFPLTRHGRHLSR
jgi:hypothetical protein